MEHRTDKLMNPDETSRTFPRAEGREGGFALVLVLAILVLILGLAVAFFSMVTSDTTSSRNYDSAVRVKQLSDIATNLVMGEIGEATQSGTGSGARFTWASQPGMIRKYDDSGRPSKFYKLYSSSKLTFDPNVSDLQSELAADLPATWASQPALFTDINAPVLDSDPSGPITINGRTYGARYPILSPGGLGKIDGFSIGNSTTPPDPGLDPTAAENTNPAPMPVSWIYVLQDGSLASPDGTDASGKVISQWTGAVPTKDNPIAGRVAFWTDDETCKVNINTASEGSFWDTPRANTAAERLLPQICRERMSIARPPGIQRQPA